MRKRNLTIVKVGGSLYDWPELGAKLRAFLASLPARQVLIFPGGGLTVDAVRALDRVHRLGEEESHWLALEALSLNARFLQRLLPRARIVSLEDEIAQRSRIKILNPDTFFSVDEVRPDHLPHSWAVTADALAARAAALTQARQLILLKSVPWAGDDWRAASRAGVVDDYFPAAIKQAPAEMSVRVVNLRCNG